MSRKGATESKHLSVAFLDSTKDSVAFQQISRCGFEDCEPNNTFEEGASHVTAFHASRCHKRQGLFVVGYWVFKINTV